MKKVIFSIIIFAFIGKLSVTGQDLTIDKSIDDRISDCAKNAEENSSQFTYFEDTTKNKTDKRIEEHREARQLFEKKKLQFFTQEMELTEEEANVFFPVFNQLENKHRKIGHERKKNFQDFESKKSTITDTEAKQLNKQLVDLQKQEYDLTTEYQKLFETILTPKKLFLFYKAQDKFQRGLLKSMSAKN